MLTESVMGIIFALNQKNSDGSRSRQPKFQSSFGFFSLCLIVAEELMRNVMQRKIFAM